MTEPHLDYVAADVLDAELDDIARADRLVLCEGFPHSASEADTWASSGGMKLAEASASFEDPVTDGGYRVMRLRRVIDVPVIVAGVWDYVGLMDDEDGSLKCALPSAYGEVVDASAGDNTVTLGGHYRDDMDDGSVMSLRETPDNDGIYTVSSTELDAHHQTVVHLTEEATLTSSQAGGFALYGARTLREGSHVTTQPLDIYSTLSSV